MGTTMNRVAGALYGIGLHHESGESSMVALAARPVRMTVGELAAWAADLIGGTDRDDARRPG